MTLSGQRNAFLAHPGAFEVKPDHDAPSGDVR
jgi:hypothetical protein